MNLLYYRAANGWTSAVGVTFWDVPGVVLVVLSELSDNHGPSITNNVELVARRVVELLGMEPEHTIIMEHYPAGCYGGSKEETFDLVRLTGEGGGPITKFPEFPSADAPQWTPMTPAKWAELSRAAGGFAWGEGPPNVRVPAELKRRFDGIPPGDFDPALIRESEDALVESLRL